MSKFARISAVIVIIDFAIAGIAAIYTTFSVMAKSGWLAFLLLAGATLSFSFMALVYSLAFALPDEVDVLSAKVNTLQKELKTLKNQCAEASSDTASPSGIKPVSSADSLQRKKKLSTIAEESWRCPECGCVNLKTQVSCFSCGKTKPAEDADSPGQKVSAWVCPKCKKTNLGSRDTCWACGAKK